MSALENDINRAIEILSYLSKKYNMMVNYSRIYQNNTENVKGYMKYFMAHFGHAKCVIKLLYLFSDDKVIRGK